MPRTPQGRPRRSGPADEALEEATERPGELGIEAAPPGESLEGSQGPAQVLLLDPTHDQTCTKSHTCNKLPADLYAVTKHLHTLIHFDCIMV